MNLLLVHICQHQHLQKQFFVRSHVDKDAPICEHLLRSIGYLVFEIIFVLLHQLFLEYDLLDNQDAPKQIDNLYSLEDEDRKVIASELQAIEASDEAFASYQDKLSVVLKHKNKEHLGRLAEETEAKITAEVEKRLSELNKSTASTKTEAELAEEALEKAKASAEKTIPNNNGETSQENKSLKEKFASAFSRENILIS